jgi:hypothetical protein
VRLHLGRVAGLGDADRNRRLPRDLDGRGDADHVHVVVLLALVGRPDRKVTLLVGREPDRTTGDVLADERRDHHRIRRRDLRAVGEHQCVRCDVGDRRPEPGVDVLPAQEHAQQRLAVRQTADAEMP